MTHNQLQPAHSSLQAECLRYEKTTTWMARLMGHGQIEPKKFHNQKCAQVASVYYRLAGEMEDNQDARIKALRTARESTVQTAPTNKVVDPGNLTSPAKIQEDVTGTQMENLSSTSRLHAIKAILHNSG